MKSYNETVNNVFRRINEYETVQKRKRKIISRTVTSLCCACMIAIIGIGSHNIMTSSPWGNEQTESNHNNPDMTQASAKPPTFVIFCNDKELFHYSYQRYIENQIRESFGLDGTPIKIIARERGE